MTKRWTLQDNVHTIHIDLDVVSDEDKAHVLSCVAESGRKVEVLYYRSSEMDPDVAKMLGLPTPKHNIETHRCKDCFS
jgi:hypothetical protein